MRNYFTYILLLVFGLTTFAQTNDPNLNQYFNKDVSDTDKLRSLENVDWVKVYVTLDTLMMALDEGIELAEKLDHEFTVYKFKLIRNRNADKSFEDKVATYTQLRGQTKEKGFDSLFLLSVYRKARLYEDRNDFQKARDTLEYLLEEHKPELNDYPKVHSFVCEELGIIYEVFGDQIKVRAMYEKALSLNRQLGDSAGMCSNLLNIGGSYFMSQDLERAKEFNRKGLRLSQSINQSKFEMDAYLDMANVFGFSEQFDSCLVVALKANSIAEKHGFLVGQIITSDIISACYLNLENPERAIGYQLNAYNLETDLYNKNRLALNVGLCYIDLEDFSKAETYYKEAYELATSAKAPLEQVNVLVHMGFLYLRSKSLATAKEKFTQAANSLEEGQDPYLYNEIQRGLGLTASKEGNPVESNKYLKTALPNMMDYSNIADVHKAMAINYKKLNQFDSSVEAYESYIIFQDSLAKKSNKTLEQTILAKYAVEKAESKANLAVKDKEISDLNAQRQNRMKTFGFLLFGLSLVSIFVILNKHRLYKIERERNAALEMEASQIIIDHSREILANQSNLIIDKNRIIDELKNNLDLFFSDMKSGGNGVHNFLENRILTNEDWDKFKVTFSIVYPGFIEACETTYKELTANELRLLCLHKLGMTKSEIAEMLAVLPSSVKRSINRFYQKYNNLQSDDMYTIVERINVNQTKS